MEILNYYNYPKKDLVSTFSQRYCHMDCNDVLKIVESNTAWMYCVFVVVDETNNHTTQVFAFLFHFCYTNSKSESGLDFVTNWTTCSSIMKPTSSQWASIFDPLGTSFLTCHPYTYLQMLISAKRLLIKIISNNSRMAIFQRPSLTPFVNPILTSGCQYLHSFVMIRIITWSFVRLSLVR